YDPEYIAICFDLKGPTFRTKEYADYKGHRDKTPSELEQQIPIMHSILKEMNFKTMAIEGFEADDIAGSLAELGKSEGLEILFLTGDKDYLQLVDNSASVLFTQKGSSLTKVYTPESVFDEYELTPKELIDLKVLMGDASDNIPGVPGIGIKTGIKLIKEYKSIENLYDNIDELKKSKMKENLIENEPLAHMSKKLGTIVTNMNLDETMNDFKREAYNTPELACLYEKYEFNTLLSKLDYKNGEVEPAVEYKYEINVDSNTIINEITKNKEFSFKILTDGKIYQGIVPFAIAFKTGDKIFFNDYTIRTFTEFKGIFEDEIIAKKSHDIKEDIIILMNYGIEIKNYSFDTMVGEYLINPSLNNYSINKIAENHLGFMGTDVEELLGKGKNKKSLSEIERDELYEYMAQYLTIVDDASVIQRDIIESFNMLHLLDDIELPLIEVLASMEFKGFNIDASVLEDIGVELTKEIDNLTAEIYKQAGHEFNINSPKQLGVILFDELNLPVIKKTKTGYSTNVEVLEKLSDEHPIVDLVLRYRQIVKLQSTYIVGLIDLINPITGRIHSSFKQTVAATGRISSTDPNLQNIPVKSEEGRMIRKAFVPSKSGNKLVDADYSQIELRVLAEISGDENLKQAFIDNEDIHSSTAREVFNLGDGEIDSIYRSRAKAVNFGIVYGISDYGLSRDLNIPRKEAKEYIDNYLAHYSGVSKFMKQIVDIGEEQGYVETMLNRRRYIPELQAKNFNIKSFGERIAMNTPIQGSAADIIKIAMIKVYNTLKNSDIDAELILQVHDELILDVNENDVERASEMLKREMEDAIEMSIPLKVDISAGDSWYESK
ncbi:MAG: DNA polymerase I, partial [Tissierellia bacterium]|nr:DNA polymerase I [Tissierellia bacterium]